MFTITRVYSDAEGDSRFEDISIPLTEEGALGKLSEGVPVKELLFREVAPEYDYDFHTAPQRQYIILLDGEIEIETSLGDKRTFKGGDVLLVEDVTGKGHKTRNLVTEKRRSILVTLAEGGERVFQVL
jgi:hypothetical protein